MKIPAAASNLKAGRSADSSSKNVFESFMSIGVTFPYPPVNGFRRLKTRAKRKEQGCVQFK